MKKKSPALALSLQGHTDFAGVPTRATLRRWVLLALEHDANLTLRFVGTREGRQLNRQFRGKDHATNVLTFAYQRAPTVEADIVLCMPVLRAEARTQNKTPRVHLAHLVMHGVLHAQGYDHEGPRDAALMEAREAALLAKLRIANPYDTEGSAKKA